MNIVSKQAFVILVVIVAVALLLNDSKGHFDRGLIQAKRDSNSAQTSWNLFYGQRFVFYDGPFRYTRDFENINKLIEPGHIVLSDLATSYYAAASSAMYAKNVNAHHGRWQSPGWQKMLNEGGVCNLHQKDAFFKFRDFLRKDRALSDSSNQPAFRYVLVNRDRNNKNVRSDCLWNRRDLFMQNIVRLSELKYQGEYLNLYEISDRLPATAP